MTAQRQPKPDPARCLGVMVVQNQVDLLFLSIEISVTQLFLNVTLPTLISPSCFFRSITVSLFEAQTGNLKKLPPVLLLLPDPKCPETEYPWG